MSSTSSRSAFVVTFSRRESPSTTCTRPPARSTSEAQSVAPAASPASARRSVSAGNACGVWAATSPCRAIVSSTTPPLTRFTVSPIGSAGTTPSAPSASGASTRPITSSSTNGLAQSCTSTATASGGTSAIAERTDSARVAPPGTTEPPSTRRAPRRAGSPAPPSRQARRRRSRRPTRPLEPLEALGQQRPPAEVRERLRPVRAEALPCACGDEERPNAHSGPGASGAAGTLTTPRPWPPWPSRSSSRPCRRPRSPRGRPRATRRSRPRRAPSRTSARRRGSSSP